MGSKLYKVLHSLGAEGTGVFGRLRFTDGVSPWVNKVDADQSIACGVAQRCAGPVGPYFAVAENDSPAFLLRAENLVPHFTLPDECVVTFSTQAERTKGFCEKYRKGAAPAPAPGPEGKKKK